LHGNLSANETNGACVSPSRPRPASRSNRPDTYQRLPDAGAILACEQQPVHTLGVTTSRSKPFCERSALRPEADTLNRMVRSQFTPPERESFEPARLRANCQGHDRKGSSRTMINRLGGCQCGEIHYVLSAPPLTLYVCHCRDCQRQSSSGLGMSMPVPRDGFQIIQGDPKLWHRTAASGRVVACAFCKSCGTRIYQLWSAIPRLSSSSRALLMTRATSFRSGTYG
jgi:hypothetical protein